MTGELNDFIRAQLLTALEHLKTGRRYFTYNSFNVLLDADAGTATVEDVFAVDRQSTVMLEELRTHLRTAEDS
ncbi:hypothetical protein [Arthrobacter sp. Leaf137]|uniref:hypothetical protein n=1 Tax=Arthrobacter sp. Leaf137 TaxID=1736271 RepID=UPI0012E1A26E|nr:hypothetical protein [Arthrobacter sp. Leaf137]